MSETPKAFQWGDHLNPKVLAQVLQKQQLKTADDAIFMLKDMRQRAIVERLVKKTQDGTLGKQTDEPMDRLLEDGEMNITIGDHYHVDRPKGDTGNASTTSASPQVASQPPQAAALPTGQSRTKTIVTSLLYPLLTACFVVGLWSLMQWLAVDGENAADGSAPSPSGIPTIIIRPR